MCVKRSWFWILVIALCFSPLLIGATCGGGADDDDDDDNDENDDDREKEIEDVLREMIEGFSLQTVEALDQKVMPNISEDYDYAGLTRAGYRDMSVFQLDQNDGQMTILGYEIKELDIEVEDGSATCMLHLSYQARFEFDDDIEGSLSGSADVFNEYAFVLEAEDWRVVRISSLPGGSGLFETEETADLPIVTGLEVEATETLQAGSSVGIIGEITLPELGDDRIAFVEASLSWNPYTVNLADHSSEGESVYRYDIPESGGSLNLAVTLPNDGLPEGLSIPGDFAPGVDEVSLGIMAIVAEVDGSDITVLGAVSHSFSYPLEPFTSDWSCDNAPGAGATGIWKLEFSDTPWIALPQLLDLTLVGNGNLASILWMNFDEDTSEPGWILASLDGTADESEINLTFAVPCPDPGDGDMQFTWTGNITGTQITSGFLDVDGCEFPDEFGADFQGQKVTNRCDYVPDEGDAEGVYRVSLPGLDDQFWTLTLESGEETNVIFTDGSRTMSGVFHDNRLAVANQDDPRDAVLMVFHDQDMGTFYRYAAGSAEGTFERMED